MDKAKSPRRIKVIENGPYVVTGGVPLIRENIVIGEDGEPARWEKDTRYPDRKTYALCRCGASGDKPFCDGAHSRIGFDGTETACHDPYLAQAEKTPGAEIDLTWSRKLCAMARFCHRAGDAWTLAENSHDPEAKSQAIQEACDCPSGSLVAWDPATGRPIEPALEPSIGLIENPTARISGPLFVKSGIPIESAAGVTYEIRNRVTLCRCGKSNNKPFCDGTHLTIGFRSGP